MNEANEAFRQEMREQLRWWQENCQRLIRERDEWREAYLKLAEQVARAA